MRVYADSTFLLRLLLTEPDSEGAVACYRRLGKPCLFFLPLHMLEVRNAIFQRAFHQRHSASSLERRWANRERDAALGRLQHLITQRTLLQVSGDMDAVIDRAGKLSSAHGERLGPRAIDLLHVAAALILKSELFLTTDARQQQLAKAEHLKVASVG